jgi:ribokinase
VAACCLGKNPLDSVCHGDVLHTTALVIEPIDTVGAGDTFCGYLAAGIANGDEFERVLRTAALAGSLACLRPGAQAAIPDKQTVQQHL